MRMTGNYKHGGQGTRLYHIWKTMRQRCNTKTSTKYKYYGGRGITICHEWDDYKAFREWALRNGYSDSLTIERIDVDGNYCPENCRWATLKEQANNRTSTHWVEWRGKKISMKAYCEMIGINYSRFSALIQKGASIEEATKNECSLRGIEWTLTTFSGNVTD